MFLGVTAAVFGLRDSLSVYAACCGMCRPVYVYDTLCVPHGCSSRVLPHGCSFCRSWAGDRGGGSRGKGVVNSDGWWAKSSRRCTG